MSTTTGNNPVVYATEVPGSLKRLVRIIMRGFYAIDYAILVDFLIHHPCVKEDDILELLKFDRKQLRAIITTLKADKFLKTRIRMETDDTGTTTKHNYYFINFSTFVNVVKYKLDHMRKKIETEERDSTSRSSFKCPKCEKTYTDLEADQLFDFNTGTFRCTYCNEEVQEEASATPKTDAKQLMLKFNEQIQPVFALLQEVEDVKLAPELLEPEPTDMKSTRPQHKNAQPNKTAWSGDASRGINFGYVENQEISINMGEETSVSAEKKNIKDQPVWMKESTIEGAVPDPLQEAAPSTSAVTTFSTMQTNVNKENDEVMRTLLAHEKTAARGPALGGSIARVGRGGSDNDTTSSESEDELIKASSAVSALSMVSPVSRIISSNIMESEEEEEDLTITVAGNMVHYNEVTPDMVERMTPVEKDAYIRLGQQIHENLYD